MSALSLGFLLGIPFVAGFIVGYATRSLVSQHRRAKAARYRAIKD
jgi:hypothetical protein